MPAIIERKRVLPLRRPELVNSRAASEGSRHFHHLAVLEPGEDTGKSSSASAGSV